MNKEFLSRINEYIPNFVRKWIRELRIQYWLRRGYQKMRKRVHRDGLEIIHFLHVSKTGGTAIKSAIGEQRRTDHYRILITPHPVRLKHIPNNEKFAVVLRDPVRRFVSAFNHRLAEGRPGYDAPWSRQERLAFSWFPDANTLGLALASEDATLRKRAVWAMRNIGLLDTPYTFWLGDLAYLKSRQEDLFFVGFQESLTDDFERFKELAGYPEEVCLPSDGQKANRTGSNSTALAPTAEAALRDWYAEDYNLYEYCSSFSEKSC